MLAVAGIYASPLHHPIEKMVNDPLTTDRVSCSLLSHGGQSHGGH